MPLISMIYTNSVETGKLSLTFQQHYSFHHWEYILRRKGFASAVIIFSIIKEKPTSNFFFKKEKMEKEKKNGKKKKQKRKRKDIVYPTTTEKYLVEGFEIHLKKSKFSRLQKKLKTW